MSGVGGVGLGSVLRWLASGARTFSMSSDPTVEPSASPAEPGAEPPVPAPVETGEAPAAAQREAAPEAAPLPPDQPAPGPAPTPSGEGAPPAGPRVFAVANQKGGVGKTTTAVNLGAALAERGARTLLIDLDPQGNASTGVGIRPRELEATVYDALLDDTPLADCIVPTQIDNLWVVPANLDLAGAEIELVPVFSRELRLRRVLDEVKHDYEYIFIDCPPSLGLLTVNALAAADEVLVPMQCEYYALEGLAQLLGNIELVRKNVNPQLVLGLIVLVMYDARTNLAEQVATEVRGHFPGKVCRTVVPRQVRLSEAPSYGQPIITFDPTSRGAIAYRELAKEVSGGTS